MRIKILQESFEPEPNGAPRREPLLDQDKGELILKSDNERAEQGASFQIPNQLTRENLDDLCFLVLTKAAEDHLSVSSQVKIHKALNAMLDQLDPQWDHDCEECIFLGQYRNEDLYYHPGVGNTLIARAGSEDSDYTSGLELAIHLMKSNRHHPLAEAYRRAQERRLL